ncbi:MAG: hypothetical protein AAF738_06080, partial [Bacteroidota bacterium]
GNTFNTNRVFPFESTFGDTYDFSFDWQVPNTLSPGTYQVSIGATDGVRNVANFVNFEVEIN